MASRLKAGLGIDVLTAARERLRWTFETFRKVYVSFSGGKDSTVMLDLTAEAARQAQRKFGLLFIDLEGQYKLTIDHVRRCFDRYADVIHGRYWVCLPLILRNAVSQFEPRWICWDPTKRAAWIREPEPGSITDQGFFPFYRYAMEFEE